MIGLRAWWAARSGFSIAGMVLALLIFVAAIAVWLWLPNDQQLAKKVEQELSTALGVKVSVASVHWQLLPVATIVLATVSTEQTPPVSIKKLTLHPRLAALFKRSLAFDLAELDGAVVPQLSLRELGHGAKAANPSIGLPLATTPLARFVFRDVTWISRYGNAVVYDGDVNFDESWRPHVATLSRPGYKPLTQAILTRVGQQDQWQIDIQLGGGTAKGELKLKTSDAGQMQLDGQLKLQAIEVASALEAFNRRSVIGGKAAGDTTLVANGASFGALVQSLETHTTFAMAPAKLLRFDLNKAVHSAGKDHSGQTALDNVAGTMNTQNTPEGMVVTFKNIKAHSGALSATGDATLAKRHIDAKFAVDVVDGLVGVPLTLTGPTDKVVVGVPAGAVAGAVVGTAVLPVVGTAIGARLGAAIGRLFGSAPAVPASGAQKAKP